MEKFFEKPPEEPKVPEKLEEKEEALEVAEGEQEKIDQFVLNSAEKEGETMREIIIQKAATEVEREKIEEEKEKGVTRRETIKRIGKALGIGWLTLAAGSQIGCASAISRKFEEIQQGWERCTGPIKMISLEQLNQLPESERYKVGVFINDSPDFAVLAFDPIIGKEEGVVREEVTVEPNAHEILIFPIYGDYTGKIFAYKKGEVVGQTEDGRKVYKIKEGPVNPKGKKFTFDIDGETKKSRLGGLIVGDDIVYKQESYRKSRSDTLIDVRVKFP